MNWYVTLYFDGKQSKWNVCTILHIDLNRLQMHLNSKKRTGKLDDIVDVYLSNIAVIITPMDTPRI